MQVDCFLFQRAMEEKERKGREHIRVEADAAWGKKARKDSKGNSWYIAWEGGGKKEETDRHWSFVQSGGEKVKLGGTEQHLPISAA